MFIYPRKDEPAPEQHSFCPSSPVSPRVHHVDAMCNGANISTHVYFLAIPGPGARVLDEPSVF
jgi:hypothetical protein